MLLEKAAMDFFRQGTKPTERKEQPYLQVICTHLDLKWSTETVELLVTDTDCYVAVNRWYHESIRTQVAEIQVALSHKRELGKLSPILETKLAVIPYAFVEMSIEHFKSFPLSAERVAQPGTLPNIDYEIIIKGAGWDIEYTASDIFHPEEWKVHMAILNYIEAQCQRLVPGLFY